MLVGQAVAHIHCNDIQQSAHVPAMPIPDKAWCRLKEMEKNKKKTMSLGVIQEKLMVNPSSLYTAAAYSVQSELRANRHVPSRRSTAGDYSKVTK